MKRFLVTGAAGFTGGHLTKLLIESGAEVVGLERRSVDPNIVHIPLHTCDLRDEERVFGLLREYHPTGIFHLAGRLKGDSLEELSQDNVVATDSLLRCIVRANQRPRVLITSSSAVYGRGLGSRPITESFRPRPTTDYAVSKLAQEAVGLKYAHSQSLPIVFSRAFNLVGPGQPDSLACSRFARQIANAEGAPYAKPILVGNTMSVRDFTDVRDAARAYVAILKHGRPGEVFNVCSGKGVRLQGCLDLLLTISGAADLEVLQSGRSDPHDVPVQVGANGKLSRATGWAPEIPLRQSLSDLLEYWRRSRDA